MGPVVMPEEWFKWSAHSLGAAVCRDHAQYPAFSPDTSEVAVECLVFLYLVVHNLPQLRMFAVKFSPL